MEHGKKIVKADSVYQAEFFVRDTPQPPPPLAPKPSKPSGEKPPPPAKAKDQLSNSQTVEIPSDKPDKAPSPQTDETPHHPISVHEHESHQLNNEPPKEESSKKLRGSFLSNTKDHPPLAKKDKKEGKKRGKLIDKIMKRHKNTQNSVLKILLLGTGESGKTTIAKQMKILHSGGFTKEERHAYVRIVVSSLFDSLSKLIEGCKTLGYTIEATAELELVKKTLEGSATIGLSPQLISALKVLWNDPGIKKAFEERSKFQVVDNSDYFFTRLNEIASSSYSPTDDDILRSRTLSSGIIETDLKINADTNFKLIDVGGQRNERKKWVHCFDDVTAILFVVAMNEYDLTLREDGKTNRLEESLKIFQEIVTNKTFKKTPIILFLNKYDLFAEKIKHVDLTVAECCKDYAGGKNEENAKQYLEKKFLSLCGQKQVTYVHFTTALDTDLVRKVLENVTEIIVASWVSNMTE